MQLLFQNNEVLSPHNHVQASYDVFNVPYYIPKDHEADVAVSVEDCAESIREIKRVVDQYFIPLNLLQVVRINRSL